MCALKSAEASNGVELTREANLGLARGDERVVSPCLGDTLQDLKTVSPPAATLNSIL